MGLILRNGVVLPHIAMSANWFGYNKMCELFKEGLRCGVRAFDTAREYDVEHQVGAALQDAINQVGGVKRSDLFITTRISNHEIRKGNIIGEIERSLKKMGLEYLDCFMFHWPTPDYYLEAWKQMEAAYKNGLCRSLGICNLRERHILQMLDNSDILPHVLQIEIHPLRQVPEIVRLCRQYGIVIQSFSPICKMIPLIKENATLNVLARKYNVNIAQLIIRWHIQSGFCPVTMTSRVERVKDNFAVPEFIISDDDMRLIKNEDRNYKFHLESTTCPGF